MNESQFFIDWSLIVWLLVSMLFSAFFSGMEIAFVSSNRLLAEMDREKNGLSQKAISYFYQHPSNFVSTMLVGNNIALVIYGILFARIFDTTLFAPLSDGMRPTRCSQHSSSCLRASSCRRPSSRTIRTQCSPSLPFRRGCAMWCSGPSRALQPSFPRDSCDLWASG